jgi:glycosyltransferase involved in cell wall biosynthesis
VTTWPGAHPSDRRPRIVVVTNTAWNMLRFRSDLLRELSARGWRALAASVYDEAQRAEVRALGAEPVDIPIDSAGINPVADLRLLIALRGLYATFRPQAVHHFSSKPAIYGAIAARLAAVPSIVSSITGLGIAFDPRRPILNRTVTLLYRMSLRGRVVAIFENAGHHERFLSDRLIEPRQALVLPGSVGIDIEAIRNSVDGIKAEPGLFVMVGRMIWSKGVGDFVEAARLLKRDRPEAHCVVVGGTREDYASANPDFVPKEWLQARTAEGVITWVGLQGPGDVERWMARATAVVLPSFYAEGMPRTLMEAAAVGRAIVTTDNPGCREAVIDSVTGLVCPQRSPQALAAALQSLLDRPERAAAMGEAGLRLARERFDQHAIFKTLFALYGVPAIPTGRPA